MGKWKSKYGDAFIAFPARDDQLNYELLQLEKGS